MLSGILNHPSSPLLNGAASVAYHHPDQQDALDYEKVKVAMLDQTSLRCTTRDFIGNGTPLGLVSEW